MDCGMTNFTHAHTKTISQSRAESDVSRCAFPCSHELRSLSTKLALMYKLSFPATLSLSTLSHSNLDDYHSWRLIERSMAVCLRVCVCALRDLTVPACFSLYLSVHSCVSANVFILWAEAFAHLWCHCLIAQWQWSLATSKARDKNLVTGRVFSLPLIIIILNCFITGGIRVYYLDWN